MGLPADQLFGAEGAGFRIAKNGLNGRPARHRHRLARRRPQGPEHSRVHLAHREAFGGRLLDAQALRFRLADPAPELAAARAFQPHVGHGYLSAYGIEKIVRDLRVHRILEGTNEIMRVIVARGLTEVVG